MAERDARRDLTLLAEAARLRAEQRVHEARRAAASADAAAATARSERAEAARAWEAHLRAGRFSPELAGALGAILVDRADAARAADEACASAQDAVALREAARQRAAAREQIAEAFARRSARVSARRREARLADAFETEMLARRNAR